MRRIVTTLISLLFVVTALSARQLERFFVSRPEDQGMIYFLKAQSLFSNENEGVMSHDFTVREYLDSCTMNFTYKMDMPTRCDSIRIESSSKGVLASGPVRRLYIELQKGHWTHRYSFDGLFSSIKNIYDVDDPATVIIYSEGKSYPYSAKSGAWRRYATIGTQIFKTIEINVAPTK